MAGVGGGVEPRLSAAERAALNTRCQKLLADLRKQCPEIPQSQVPTGTVAEPVVIPEKEVGDSLIAMLTDSGRRNTVVWAEGDSEAIVHFDQTKVLTLPHGLMLVGITLQTVESGPKPVTLTVPFALGHDKRVAGMIAMTEPRPRGPAVLVDRWGDAVVATAWQALLDLAAVRAAAAGSDAAGRPLMPAGLLVDPPRLVVVPRAPFDFEAAVP